MPIINFSNDDELEREMRELIGAKVIQLYSIQDFALQNKVFNWLTNHFEDDETLEILENDPTIQTVVTS
jgi:DNA repair photolyase